MRWHRSAYNGIRCAITCGCRCCASPTCGCVRAPRCCPCNTRFWEYADDTQDCVLATLWGVLNLLFLIPAAMAVWRGPRPQYLALMLLFVLLRSAFLGTLENPEPRYTLECYPVVLVLAAGWIAGLNRRAITALFSAMGVLAAIVLLWPQS